MIPPTRIAPMRRSFIVANCRTFASREAITTSSGEGLALLREWVPFEVLHFPIRSRDHLLDKYVAVTRRAV